MRPTHPMWLLSLTALVLFVLAPTDLRAQSAAIGVIRLLVGYSPGSATDLFARATAKLMGEQFGQSVVVENRPGAGALIAVESVKRSNPDGSTLLWINNGEFTILPTIRAVEFDPQKDFVPLAMMVDMPAVYVAAPAVPATTMQQFIELAKQKPGMLRWGSPGTGSGAYMLGEMLGLKAGIEITHVAYKGGGEVLAALLKSEIDLGIQTYGSVAPMAKEGKLKMLATTGSSRFSGSDVPTMRESGFPDFKASSWWGVVAPAGLPKTIADRLESELMTVAHSKAFKDILAQFGPAGEPLGTSQFAQLIAHDLKENRSIIEQAKAAGHMEN